MAIILPDLPYAYDALEPYIDAETMTLHHDKHHATYVANANAALEKHPEIGEDLEALLADVEKIPADIRQALINNGGGHLNHALFWELLSPEKQEPTAEVAAAINEAFGSFEAFQEVFTTAATTRFGSGWAWLVVNAEGKLEVVSTPNLPITAIINRIVSRIFTRLLTKLWIPASMCRFISSLDTSFLMKEIRKRPTTKIITAPIIRPPAPTPQSISCCIKI